VFESDKGIRGLRLAHFELIEPIGVGGMAAVLRARDTQLDRLVALKILPPEMATDAENVRRFHQEARSAAKLDHENIARVFYCGEDQRLHFIAFEFVEGENLRTLLERRGRLPFVEAIHYMLQVAAGLAHSGRRGVVHRDIKPSNIIIMPNGRAKLVDMGLARSLEPPTDNDLTQSGVTLGTFDYISPEQALEPRDADVRSDIYSLGCTFYHVLTGRTPVPDGTAAKKLHHHQHVKPVDPRQYVPDLPLEVVHVLDRMMAKNPRDRYQSPEELVHQLLQVARKLGGIPEVPEGVLSVETTVPSPPTGRPLLWAGLATVGVIALVLFLGQTPSGPEGPGVGLVIRPEPGDLVHADKSKNTGPAIKPLEVRPPDKVGSPEVTRYKTPPELSSPIERGRHLINWLQQNRDAPYLELLLAGELDLSSAEIGPTRGLLVQARQKVTIRPRDLRGVVTLRFRYETQPVSPEGRLVALRVESPQTDIEGVRILIDAAEASGVELLGLLLGPGSHRIDRCTFIQTQPSLLPGSRRQASLLVDSGRLNAEVKLRDCAFLGYGQINPVEGEKEFSFSGVETGGQVAVVRRGAARITAENCVFGPHAATFRLENDGAEEPGLVTVKHCSVLLGGRSSSAFDFTKPGSSGRLAVSYSLFCRLPGDIEKGAVLIRQADPPRPDAIVYQGQDNAYHDLDGYWAVGDAFQQAGWMNFSARMGENGNKDESPRVLLSYPWDEPTDQQKRLLNEGSLGRAFALNLKHPSVRKASNEVVGTASILGERWLPTTLPTLPEREEPVKRLLVVEVGEKDGDSSRGVYSSLDKAIPHVRPGDTILIRHPGEVKIDPVHLNKTSLRDLTIRPARGFRPILMMALNETSETEPSLFRVQDGQLRLEGLEIRLQSAQKLRTQTVVTLVGLGDCQMRDCLITLQRASDILPAATTTLALATLVEVGKATKLDMPLVRTSDQGPRLSVDGCVIRGDGDLFRCRANRPFTLEVKNSLATLAGSLLHVEVTPEMAAASDTQRMQLSLAQVMTYLGGPLVSVTVARDPQGLLPLRCDTKECLFLPAARVTPRPLIHLEGPDNEDKSRRDKFRWTGSGNAYGPYTSFLTQESGDGAGMPAPMSMEKWKSEMGEEKATFGFKLARTPTTLNFAQMVPEQFAQSGTLSLPVNLVQLQQRWFGSKP